MNRKKNIQLNLLPLVIALGMITINAKAQFTTAGIPDNTSGLSLAPFTMNNDILDFSGSTYSVSVCDDINFSPAPYLSWDVSGVGTGSVPLGLSSYATSLTLGMVDVGLVVDQGTDVHALAIWYVITLAYGNAWILEDFLWNGSAFVSQGPTIIATGSSGTAYHIDCAGDEFALIYDDYLGNINIVTGRYNNGISLYNSGSPVALGSTGMSPDICFYDGSPQTVYATFIDGSGDLEVDGGTFSTLQGGNPITNLFFSNISPVYYNFSNPRIACPDRSNPPDWTVVVEETDHNSFIIEVYNSNSGQTPIYFNDGGFVSGGDLTSVPNFFPVVTYDYSYNIWIGWIMDNRTNSITGATADAQYPIVLYCDPNANPLASPAKYWDVPLSTGIGYHDDTYLLALSGRENSSSNFVYASYFNNSPTYDLLYKFVSANSPSSLRSEKSTGNMQNLNTLFDRLNGGSETIVNLALYNLNGKLVISYRDNAQKTKHQLIESISGLSPSVYLVKIFSDNNKLYTSQKLVVN